ncbi:hypothetical protein QVD17_14223 [Tagetes erecta]|uniref:C2H2-type domain-containing protein n=1 Tax=Tagetes erecta TaxID=13708 RepID=A0AAD8P2J0_TARER|nr:hypothetical protein QVD17_14223 [Tagetes erecta]
MVDGTISCFKLFRKPSDPCRLICVDINLRHIPTPNYSTINANETLALVILAQLWQQLSFTLIQSLKMGEETVETTADLPIFRDIRRYTCAYCGIVRSKKSLIHAHIQSHHQDEIKEKEGNEEEEQKGGKMNVCEECGALFKKPAHLRQHMQSHSLEGIYLY